MRIIILLLLGLALTACGGGKDDTVTTADESAARAIETVEIDTEASASYEEAHAAAVAAIQLAGEKGHAWNTSDNLLNEAVAAAASGDEALAISLADEARIQAALAAAQADREALAWRDSAISE